MNVRMEPLRLLMIFLIGMSAQPHYCAAGNNVSFEGNLTTSALAEAIVTLPPTRIHTSSHGSSGGSSSSSSSSSSNCPIGCHCGIARSTISKGFFIAADCGHSSLDSVPIDLAEDTEILELTGNSITSIDRNSFSRAFNLTELDMSFNGIESLYGAAFRNLSTLRYLNMSNCLVSGLRNASLDGLRNVEIISLSNNLIDSVESACFHGLKSVQRLYLDGNRISELPEAVFASTSLLRILILDGNKIERIGEGLFAGLKSLEMLSMARNRINQIASEAFRSQLRSLSHLNLTDNRLAVVPSVALGGFRNLKSFYIDSNPIRKIRSLDFSSMIVREISVSRMPELRVVDGGAFNQLRQFKTLRMNKNPRLVYVHPGAIRGCPDLRALYLNGNNLTTVDVIRTLPDLQVINIDNNPLRCDCDLTWIRSKTGITSIPAALARCTTTNGCTPVQQGLNKTRCSASSNASASNSTAQNSSTENNLPAITLPPINSPAVNLPAINSPVVNSIPISLLSDPMMNIHVDDAPSTLHHQQQQHLCPPIVITLFDEAIYRPLNDRMDLDCRATGQPPPYISWVIPNSRTVTNTSNDSRMRLDAFGTLTVYHLKPSDAGIYRCLATNSAGTESSVATHLRLYNLDAQIVPVFTDFDSITITWKGLDSTMQTTAYAILHRKIILNLLPSRIMTSSEEDSGRIRLSPYMRKYTVGGLETGTSYEFCICRVEEESSREQMISCINVTTRSDKFDTSGIHHVPVITALITLASAVTSLTIFCLAVKVVSKYRRRKAYQSPLNVCSSVGCSASSSAVHADGELAHIPLDSISQLPSTPGSTSSKTSLIGGYEY